MLNKRIIIAEGENIISLDIKRLLQNNGLIISDIVSTSEDLIYKFKLLKPDLILVDLNLRGNICVKDAVIELNKTYRTPVIIISGSSQTKMKEYVMNCQNIEVLEKPFEQEELLNLVRKILSFNRKLKSLI